MVAAVEAELVENTRLEPTPGPAITAVNFGEIFAFGGQTHVRVLGNHELESTYGRTPRPTPRHGNIYPESTRSDNTELKCDCNEHPARLAWTRDFTDCHDNYDLAFISR